MTTTLRRDDLLRFLEAVGHPPQIVALDRAGAAETGSPPA